MIITKMLKFTYYIMRLKLIFEIQTSLILSMEKEDMIVRRGDMFYADLSPVVGSEQGGVRPVIIIQNDVGNKYSPTVIAAAITSKLGKTSIPTHIEIGSQNDQLKVNSMVLAEQVRTIDKSRLKEKIGHIEDKSIMNKIDNALELSIGLQNL